MAVRFTNTFTGKKNVDALRALIYPLTLRLPLRHNRPLPAPSTLLTPLDLALEGPRYLRQVDLGN